MTLALLAAALLAGLPVGLRYSADPLPVFLLALATVPVALLLRIYGRSPGIALVLGLFLLGFWRPQVSGLPESPLTVQEQQEVSLSGRIVNDPEPTARRVKLELAVESIDRGAGPFPQEGRALVYAAPPPALVAKRSYPYFRYGDQLNLTGSLQQPQPIGDFDYPAYLASLDIQGILWASRSELVAEGGGLPGLAQIYAVRRHLARSLESALPEPQSSLSRALLLGQRGQITGDLADRFRTTGTSHLLAISGLHVGVLLLLTMGVAGEVLGRQRQIYLLLPLSAIWVYVAISGLPPSALRAAIMGSVLLAAIALGRPRSLLPALALAAALMTAWNPQVLTQVSFQLSFAAMAGIAVALPLQARLREKMATARIFGRGWASPLLRHILGWTAAALLVSLAATLATFPLVAFHFNRVPLFGIFVTLLALPALPFLLVSSLVSAGAGLIHPLLGQVFGWVAWLPLSYLLALVSHGPDTTVSGTWIGKPFIWSWYLVLAGLVFLPELTGRLRRLGDYRISLRSWAKVGGTRNWSPGNWSPKDRALGFAAGILMLSSIGIILLVRSSVGADGLLHVHFFDVGQGDSILIVTPNGRQVLVDGGPEAESATRALSGVLSPMDRSLDLVALTHLDADHSRGLLQVLNRYRVDDVLVGRPDEDAALYPQWRKALERQQILPIRLFAGYRIQLEQDVSLEVLHPPGEGAPGSFLDANNSGLVLRLVYRDVSILLTADIEAEAERRLLDASATIKSDVLKIAHHGSKTSTTAPFLQKVQPSLAIISVGADNRFGHPHAEIVNRLQHTLGDRNIYRTDRNGDTEVISDGTTLWVKTQR
ncbi:MAG: DNA internalization-related competence protein ComEC/Rec2 [Chloroflexi bacterium]|nr:DNA internalization-related competence protein ComEC/Rec2 [Chloroflexota bacterium]